MTFDHRRAGTPAAAWAELLEAAPELGSATVHLVVLAAHPDDETLGAGGLIARTAAAGQAVTVVVASAGEASHPDSPTHSPDDLARRRRAEVRAAVAVLAPDAAIRCLGLPDGHLAEHGDELRAALREVVPGAGIVRLAAPYRGDGHPDHAACGAAAADVAAELGVELLEYPIWLWHWGTPAALPEVRRLPLPESLRSAKARALAEHRSQHEPLSAAAGDEAILPPGVVAHFRRPYEIFAVTPAAAHPAFFDRLYDATGADPWGFDERWYERRKRTVLLAALPRPHFGRAFEPGCATGALTAALLPRCDELIAWEVAAAARTRLTARLGDQPALRLGAGRIPGDWPSGPLDLIVLSEVGYYCSDLDELARRAGASLDADGVLVACHWRHPAPDHPHTGDEVHAALARLPLVNDVHHVEQDFVLDVLSRSGRSVARREQLV